MVAVIHSSISLRSAVNYNEQKAKEGKAEALFAGNYPKEILDMSFHQKYNRLKHQADLNVRTKVNSVHISLNFDPSEKLSADKLEAIARTYMEKIGFGDQPYLVYQHHDSGHPHLHIVTTPIKQDGKRIELHNLGKNQSEKARKEIEEDFNLVKAGNKDIRKAYELPPVQIGKLQYGQTETKRAITNVLNKVLKEYKFSSLAELNVILKQYNVLADRGSEDSQTFKRGGLVYRVLDETGNRVGVPIKASTIFGKPTLPNLEKLFMEKDAAKQVHKQRVKTAIDWAFAGNRGKTLEEVIAALKKENIEVILRKSKDGRIYGVTYVDHKTKCVFNGGDLGKEYAAKAMQERCKPSFSLDQVPVRPSKKQHLPKPNKDDLPTDVMASSIPSIKDLLKELVNSSTATASMPAELNVTKKKKKRKRRFL